MPAAPPHNLNAFPDSPYATELQRGPQDPYSNPALENEYTRARLLETRSLIRMACTAGVILAAVRGVERIAAGAWSPSLVVVGLALLASLILCIIVWSPLFTRIYLPVAKIIVPVRNSIAAIPIASAAATGQPELLMILPLMVVGPFFFSGLHYRFALFSVLLAVASFVGAAFAFKLDLALSLRACSFLFATTLACAVASRHLEQRLRRSFLESRLIAELAQLDALTGTKNRRVLDDHLSRLWQQACNDGRDIAVLLFDVDHFKAYNDRYGHQAGDQALRKVAQTLQRFVYRPLDVIARYGGEEFAVVLYDIGREAARDIAEQMRRAVSDLGIEHSGSRSGSCVTISVGVAAITPTFERRPRGALQLADEALYKAKSNGRDRVELPDDVQYKSLVTGVFAQHVVAREAS
jgi:diguanylate cyclase (GGDEF)-like protein